MTPKKDTPRHREDWRRLGLIAALLFAQSAWAFSDGSGYQILVTVQSSLAEMKKQLDELKQVRSHLNALSELSLDEAVTVARPHIERYVPDQYRSLVSSESSEDQHDPESMQEAAIELVGRLHQSVEQLRAAEPTAKRIQLLQLAQERLRRIQQEQLVDNHSLSDRQARDLQTDLLLELVNHERQRQERIWREQERSRRYRDGLSRFLY